MTDEASPFVLRSTRNRPRTAMHLGCSIAWPWQGCASHRVLDGVGRYSGGIIVGEAALYSVRTSRSMMAVPSGDLLGHAGSPEQTLSHF
jgi:hypothetical protein